jgi:hypothetical protein
MRTIIGGLSSEWLAEVLYAAAFNIGGLHPHIPLCGNTDEDCM